MSDYTTADIVRLAREENPTEIAKAFDAIVGPKIVDALETRKQEIAKTMFSSSDVEIDQDLEDIEDTEE